jgi:hypothetical protein
VAAENGAGRFAFAGVVVMQAQAQALVRPFISKVPGAIAVAALAGGLLLASGPSRAGELYLKGGLPGAILGWAQPMGSHFGLRVDVGSIGTISERRTEDGITYDGRLKADRAALLADWFVFGGSFRFTGGVTSARYSLDLAATGAGGTLTLGDTTYTTTASDRFSVKVKMPSSMPYLGLGWGHQSNSGLRFSLDLGAKFGKAALSYTLSGPWAGSVAQSDIDAELAELRDGVGKIKLVPQLTLGLGYSF